VSPAGITRIGVIVPSSNTALEAAVAAMHLPPDQVAVHVTRVGVTTISLDSQSSLQFGQAPMVMAGRLLADAGIDALTWAGTSGSWLGVERDRALARALSDATDVPASTSTLALLDACAGLGVTRVALVTPYVDPVVAQMVATYAGEGIEVVGEAHLGITDNHAFGLVTPEQIWDLAVGCPSDGAEAMVVACTNLAATGLVTDLQERLGIPVLDSIEVTVRQALAMAGAGHLAGPSLTEPRLKLRPPG
jgi:maleate isomerase